MWFVKWNISKNCDHFVKVAHVRFSCIPSTNLIRNMSKALHICASPFEQTIQFGITFFSDKNYSTMSDLTSNLALLQCVKGGNGGSLNFHGLFPVSSGISSSWSIATPQYDTLRTTFIISCIGLGSLPIYGKNWYMYLHVNMTEDFSLKALVILEMLQ